MFTGDRSGDFLFAALHRAGLASQPSSLHRGDGLVLRSVYITAPCRCAPPHNRPLPVELRRCAAFLTRELRLLPRARVFLALGAIGFLALRTALEAQGESFTSPRPAFGHGVCLPLSAGRTLLASYHVSQQNTQTGRLTPDLFDAVRSTALKLAAKPSVTKDMDRARG